MALRLITDEVVYHIASKDNKYLIKQATHLLPRPDGKALLVFFGKHTLEEDRDLHPIVKEAIEKDLGIVYVCDKLPFSYIIDPHIIYLVVDWKWMLHTLFWNPLLFKGVFHNKYTKDTALAFSVFTKYKIPIINFPSEIKDFSEVCEKSTDNILLEIRGGVGDFLMCIPTIKTLHTKGKKVSILCEEQRKPCFAGLDYIEKIYTRKEEINSQLFDRVFWLDFGSLLNDYHSDLNKKNRIYSVAEVCGIRKEELTITIPEIKLTDEETKNKYESYPKKIFFGFGSNRADAIIPQEKTQEIINKLKINGFTVFISSLRGYNFENCINLTGKLSLREYFSLINSMDYILTVDSSPLHIAASLGKKTFALINYFDPSWRCETYKNIKVYTPRVSCFPCAGGAFRAENERLCRGSTRSCYSFFDWDRIITNIISNANTSNEDIIEDRESLVSIIIPVHNQVNYTKDCIKSILLNTENNFEIIIIDNGSTDETGDYLNSLQDSRITFIKNQKNLGYGAANNQGIKLAKGEYVLFLNNDTVVGKKWLDVLLTTLNDSSIGLTGAAGGVLNNFRGIGEVKNKKIDVDYIVGWCLLIKKNILDKIGGFDLRFQKAYCEDADLSFQVRQFGYRTVVTPNIDIIHFGSKTAFSQKDFNVALINEENRKKLKEKWGGVVPKIKNLSKILLIRDGAIGDVLMTTPIIKALKVKFPISIIDYSTNISCRDILIKNPFLDNIITDKSKVEEENYNYVFNLKYEAEPQRNYLDVLAEQAGVVIEDKKSELYLDSEDFFSVHSILSPLIDKKLVAFHTGRTWESREWKIENFKIVEKYLKEKGYTTIELGDKATQLLGASLDLRGMASVRQTASILKNCIAFIGVDSLVAHLAKAVNTPAFIIYGCIDPILRKSVDIEYPISLENLECKGCHHKEKNKVFTECKRDKVYCLEGITPDMITKKFEEIIK